MRITIAVCFSLVLASVLSAQDTIERLKQMSVESACFDFPSIVHFDLTFTIESTKLDTLRIERYLGRFVQGKDSTFRSDTLHIGDLDYGGEPTMEHMVCLPNGDRYHAFETPSAGFYKVKLEPKHPPRAFVSQCNPFHFLMDGPSTVGNRNGQNVFKDIFLRMENFDGHPNMLRAKAGTIVWKVEFDAENDWQVNRWWCYFPKNGLRQAEQKRVVKSMEETKDWVCVVESRAYWREVQGIGSIPCWILSKDEGRIANDPSQTTELEAFFFGFEFEDVPLDRLFDEQRFNEKLLKEDFKIDEVKQLSEKAKKEIETERLKSVKK